MSGTTVTYNNVIIRDCETVAFDQGVVYDESNSDVIYSRFRIRVRGTLHSSQLVNHAIQATTGVMSPYLLLQVAQAKLQQSRQEFLYSVDDGVILAADSVAGSPYCDVDNGPKPRVIDIQPIGAKVFKVEFEVEIARVLCLDHQSMQVPTGALAAEPVLNNRWSVSDEKDGNFFTTRTIEGTIRVKHWKYWPHSFRHLCIPPLSFGFKRETMRFYDSTDGLHLRYHIVDRQRYMAPPAPATEMSGTYTEESGQGGAVGSATLHVTLDGPPGVDKQHLIQAAISVLLARMRGILTPELDDGAQMQDLRVVEHFDAPRIEVYCRAIHVQHLDTKWQARLKQMEGTFVGPEFADYHPGVWPVPAAYCASLPATAWAHYWQDPCSWVHGIAPIQPIKPVGGEEKDNQDGGNPEIILEVVEPQGIDGDPQASEEQKKAEFYTFYEIDSDHDIQVGMVHLPYAAMASARAGTQSFVAKVHQGLCQRVVTIRAERINKAPKFPEPKPSFTDRHGIVHTLLRWKPYMSSPALMANGRSKVYRGQMKYYYAMSRLPTVTETLRIGHDPRIVALDLDALFWMNESFEDVNP